MIYFFLLAFWFTSLFSMNSCDKIHFTQVMILAQEAPPGQINYTAIINKEPGEFTALKEKYPELIQLYNISICAPRVIALDE